MGRDKASIGDPPWAHRVAEVLAGAGCSPVELQGGDPALGTPPLALFADQVPLGGPAPAIAQAAVRHRGSPLVVAACDLPALDVEAVTGLLESARRRGGLHRGKHVYRVGERPNWSLMVLGTTEVAELAELDPERLTDMSLRLLLGRGAIVHRPDDPAAVTDIDRPGDLIRDRTGHP